MFKGQCPFSEQSVLQTLTKSVNRMLHTTGGFHQQTPNTPPIKQNSLKTEKPVMEADEKSKPNVLFLKSTLDRLIGYFRTLSCLIHFLYKK